MSEIKSLSSSLDDFVDETKNATEELLELDDQLKRVKNSNSDYKRIKQKVKDNMREVLSQL